MTTNVFLLRHGETTWTVEDLFNGHTDTELTDRGRAQASSVGRLLQAVPVVAIYCSPMRRCIETASIVGRSHGLTPIIQEDLIELDYGVWDGMRREAIVAQFPQVWAQWVQDPATIAPPEGETGYAALARASVTLRRIVAEHQEQSVLVVAHKAINRLLLCDVLGLHPRYYRLRIGQAPCALNRIEWCNGEARVTLMNQSA